MAQVSRDPNLSKDALSVLRLVLAVCLGLFRNCEEVGLAGFLDCLDSTQLKTHPHHWLLSRDRSQTGIFERRLEMLFGWVGEWLSGKEHRIASHRIANSVSTLSSTETRQKAGAHTNRRAAHRLNRYTVPASLLCTPGRVPTHSRDQSTLRPASLPIRGPRARKSRTHTPASCPDPTTTWMLPSGTVPSSTAGAQKSL